MKNSLLGDIKVQFSFGQNKKEDFSLSDFGRFANNRNEKFKERVFKELAKEKITDINSAVAKALRKKERVNVVHNTKKIAGQSAAMKELNNNVINTSYSKDMEAKTLSSRYRIIALTFFRLVARTPIDEDYYYHFYEIKELKHKGKTRDSYTKEIVRKHTKDDSVARDDWECLINLESGKELKITTQNLEALGLNFENEHDNNSIRTLTSYLIKQSGGEPYTHFQFINLNEHFEYLEFGLYYSNGKYASENTKYAHKGEKRFHGSINEYSVQAPRGIVRLTAQEFSSAVNNVIQRSEETGRQQKMLARKIKFDKDWGLNKETRQIIAENFAQNFTEKDIYKAYLEGKDTLDINTDEEKQKFNLEQSNQFQSVLKEFKSKFKTEVEKIEKAKKKNSIPKKRGKDKTKRTRTKSIYGEVVISKYRTNLEILGSYAKETGNYGGEGSFVTIEYDHNNNHYVNKVEYKIEANRVYILGEAFNGVKYWMTPEGYIKSFLTRNLKSANQIVESIIKELNKEA